MKNVLIFSCSGMFHVPGFIDARFASSNQCNGLDLLENTIVKLRSVYVP